MHIADVSIGVLGANGEVAGGLPIAVGAGMAIKMQKKDSVVISFFGDGASNRGAFHEALNWASIYRLPVIFLNENNQFASTERVTETTSVQNIADRAVGYNIPGVTVDGNDVMAVYEVVKEAVDRARSGGGPTLIEAKTYRIKGHFVGDPVLYRSEREVNEKWQFEPISRFESTLFEMGMITDAEKEFIWREAEQEIKNAVNFAEKSKYPEPESALQDLFESDTGYDY
jgi:TPP-dependent pyruvate/acetoin dehydrogenase alpha subunit